jgi:Bacterial Ig-like domain (group 3)
MSVLSATRTAPRRRRIGAGIMAAALTAAVAMTLASSRPSAADVDLGTLQLAPHSGTASQANINLTTSSIAQPAGCPDGASQASVTISGPGGWADGIAFTSFKALTSSSELTIPLSPTIADAGARAGAPVTAGRYVISVTCLDRLGVNSFGSFTAPIWFTDESTWQDSDPATTTTLTQISMVDSPAGRVDEGGTVTLIATLTPSSATGTVQFFNRVSDTAVAVGAPIPVIGGRAALATTGLDFGLHYLSATFVPDDAHRFAKATTPAPDLNFVVAHPQPKGSGG